MTRSRTALLASLFLLPGCVAPDKAHWEVSFNVNVEAHPDPQTKVSGGFTAKRGAAPAAKADTNPKKP